MAALVEIDGGFGEGGGQILRTSLTLSAITGKPVRIYNIRAGRKEPGLKSQHLVSVNSISAITSAKVEGASLNSKEIIFYPGGIRGGNYAFTIPTAGSTGLVFQTILFPLMLTKLKSHVIIRGGTHVPWAPSADYIREVFLPMVRRACPELVSGMAGEAALKVTKWGFYPAGGGEIEADISPVNLPFVPVKIEERGKLKKVSILSVAAGLPMGIAKRQVKRVVERIEGIAYNIEEKIEEVSSYGKGTFVFILAEFENIRAGFSSLGKRGKRAEDVADSAADEFLDHMDKNAAADKHLADQILLPMALAKGESVITTIRLTEHIRTNIHVIERFFAGVSGTPPAMFSIEEGGVVKITCRGVR